MDQDEFYRQNKSCAWVIKILHNDDSVTVFSGFANSENTLLTCVHPFKARQELGMIQARRLDKDKFYDMKIKNEQPKSDIVMLTFIDESVKCVYSKIADNGQLKFHDPIYYIGHFGDFVGTSVCGYSGYACPDKVPASNFESPKLCHDHKSTAWRSPPSFRTMGDVYNVRTSSSDDFQGSFNPLIPLVECVGIAFANGCAGGPVYKANGEIIGMLAMKAYGHSAAIHSTALNAFLAQSN